MNLHFRDDLRIFTGINSGDWSACVQWATEYGMEQIIDDVLAGKVPPTAESFAQLHDFVDASAYGNAFHWPDIEGERSDEYLEDFCRFWNEVQDRLDQWIKSGEFMQAAMESLEEQADYMDRMRFD